jgi:glycosyltransferase involved in cell wall biosynthesis
MPRLLSIVTPCYNERDNIGAVAEEVRRALAGRTDCTYEHVIADNASTDGTVDILREIAARDPNVKVILNWRNYGIARSTLNAILAVNGDAWVTVAADLQDPPDLIPTFIDEWNKGYKIVAAVKRRTGEGFVMAAVRRLYYRIMSLISEADLIDDFTGYGLYDREVIELLRATGDHFPYFRGLVVEMGFPISKVLYDRPDRKRGFSKNRLYHLYAEAWNGFTHQSKIPLRLAAFAGFLVAGLSLLVAVLFFLYKLRFWSSVSVGIAPIVIGLFFIGAVQLVFLGVLGEYVGAVHTRIFQRWLVVERERLNFTAPPRHDGRRSMPPLQGP